MSTTTPNPTTTTPIKILITGFGPFPSLPPSTPNPSALIPPLLSRTLHTLRTHTPITILTPPDPLVSEYHSILNTVPQLLETYNPDIVLHLGVALDQTYFSLERSAKRDGYHEIPDGARRVVSRGENKKVFGRAPEVLGCCLDLVGVVEGVRRGLGGDGGKKTRGKRGIREMREREVEVDVDVRVTDDVGNFTCGFIYFVSLREMRKRGKEGMSVFCHLPLLEGDDEIRVGVEVVEEVVRGLGEAWVGREE
ncbi:peptidase C15, pyroglutamyl peptidase I-like protein [Sporormia fimetaria CBS 119925]|uniref:Peptidase C15, pyroglutamyl peptidase I-like protein n=1 Tax=Sporormia fimetaria CBS 119925 TaxID=1340428 RepID=A0A6A6VF06_9PLEO|nr:peptidase C15, pyroglutamyl peptidase I-like protein [Sporormia fimetaria CBS 119925]